MSLPVTQPWFVGSKVDLGHQEGTRPYMQQQQKNLMDMIYNDICCRGKKFLELWCCSSVMALDSKLITHKRNTPQFSPQNRLKTLCAPMKAMHVLCQSYGRLPSARLSTVPLPTYLRAHVKLHHHHHHPSVDHI